MLKNKKIIVYEHDSLILGQVNNGITFDSQKLSALQKFYGSTGVPYFSLISKGVRFCEYVGIIQIGDTSIEVLPKIDNIKSGDSDTNQWRSFLIDMLHVIKMFHVHAPSSSSLKTKPDSILDLYYEHFIQKVEYLLHTGLVKQYRKKDSNVSVLKGNLQFSKHLQQNHTHEEKFFVRHTTYDNIHKLHQILYKTILLIKQINFSATLQSRINTLLLNFPEMPFIKVNEHLFEKLSFNRKTECYKPAIEIARLLLLNYHPDLSYGKYHLLAIMFDMNRLWEKFIYYSLKNNTNASTTISVQTTKQFWKSSTGRIVGIRPDIIINKGTSNCVVLDTKWKTMNGSNPSIEDLRQMYVYHEYFGAKSTALVYPGLKSMQLYGNYMPITSSSSSNKECKVITLAIPHHSGRNALKVWQAQIRTDLNTYCNLTL